MVVFSFYFFLSFFSCGGGGGVLEFKTHFWVTLNIEGKKKLS